MSDILDTTPVRVQRVNRNQTIHHHHYPTPPPAVVRDNSAAEEALICGGSFVVGMGIMAAILIGIGCACAAANESSKPPAKKES